MRNDDFLNRFVAPSNCVPYLGSTKTLSFVADAVMNYSHTLARGSKNKLQKGTCCFVLLATTIDPSMMQSNVS